MHLQSEETLGLHVVDDVRGRRAVDPHAQPRPDGLDAVVVPLAELVQQLRRWIHLAGVEPAALRFLVDAAAPGAIGGIDVGLVTMHAAVLEIRRAQGAELHARVRRAHVLAHVELEDEVACSPFR